MVKFVHYLISKTDKIDHTYYSTLQYKWKRYSGLLQSKNFYIKIISQGRALELTT